MRTCQVVRTLVQAAFLGTLATGFAVSPNPPDRPTLPAVSPTRRPASPYPAAQVTLSVRTSARRRTPKAMFTLRGVNPGTSNSRPASRLC